MKKQLIRSFWRLVISIRRKETTEVEGEHKHLTT